MSLVGQLNNISKKGANELHRTVIDSVLKVGKSALHALIPDDYEYYLCSLELYDSDFNKEGFLSFVVMPDQISESHTPIQTMTKTHGGIVTTFNPTFAPIDISFSGTFGKKFRMVTNAVQDPSKKSGGNILNINFGKIGNLGVGVKSGYGLTKVLESILSKSNSTDYKGKPYFLVFNNYAFNTSYLVNVVNFQFTQSYEQNMIWYYNVALKAVSRKPNKTKEKRNLLKNVAFNSISNGLTKTINNMIGF